MISSASRFDEYGHGSTPGPGYYDTHLVYGNLLKTTYNIAILEQAADI